MLGAYAGLSLIAGTGNFWLALLLAPLAVGLIGALVEVSCLRPLYRRPPLDQVLLTFGFIYLFEDLVKWIWGGRIRSIAPPDLFSGSVSVWGAIIPSYRLFVIVFRLVMAVLFWLLIERTRLGAIIRAGVYDAEMTGGLGVNIGLVFPRPSSPSGRRWAGFPASSRGRPVRAPSMGVTILIPALIVVVVGGLGGLEGCWSASLVIGRAKTFGKAWLPTPPCAHLRGDGRRDAAPTPGALRPPAQVTLRLVGLALVAVVLALFPLGAGNYPVKLLQEILIWGLFAMSLDLLMGYAGMVSFGHAAFFGIGGYVAALALVKEPGPDLGPGAARTRGGPRRAGHRLLLDPGERGVLHHAHARLLADVLRLRLPGVLARGRGRAGRDPAPGGAGGERLEPARLPRLPPRGERDQREEVAVEAARLETFAPSTAGRGMPTRPSSAPRKAFWKATA